MTSYLLDTHAFLWGVFDPRKLSRRASELIAAPEVPKLLSMGSVWEIAIKSQLGKLRLGIPLASFIETQILQRELTMVSIKLDHLIAYHALPLHHRDPFDRLLVAQARCERLSIVTSDRDIQAYEVDTVW